MRVLVGLGVALGVALAATSIAPSAVAAQPARDTVIAIDRNALLEVALQSGDVIVRGVDGNTVVARASGRTRFGVSGSPRSLRLSPTRVDGTVRVDVPVGTRLLVRNRSGDITVLNTDADVEIRSTSGDISITRAAQVRIESIAGDVDVTDASDGVRINTSSGDLVLDKVRGDVEVVGSSSEVSLLDVIARRVAVKVVSGDIDFQGPLQDGGRYSFSSHSGDVQLLLPRSSRAAIDVQTYNGELSSNDLPLVLMPDPGAREQQEALDELERTRDSMKRVVRDSLRRLQDDRRDNQRDSQSVERDLERAVERLVESLLRSVSTELESLAINLDGSVRERAGKVTRFQLGESGGPLVTVTTFSGDVVLRAGGAAPRR